MHGQGHWPPPPSPPRRRPSTAVLVVLRVLFVALPLLSIGFLAWVSTLWAAIVTRRPREWWVFAASVVTLVVSFSLLATDHTDDFSTPAGTTGMIILLLNACACAGYFLYADVRHYQSPHYPVPGPTPPAPATGYGRPRQPGYPQHPGHPYTPVPPRTPPGPQPAPPPHTHAPAPPQQPPHPGAGPARIDQVRAELDELSDYLRRHDSRHDGGSEGGGR
ncbi:hypothetical protein [Streptomyces poriticola]|uniref:hypothetical protein n=1 Tax=Streptomyces poriticola TaxID=3120506 RepID=UPI002FCE334C